jgi:hypothetical protein
LVVMSACPCWAAEFTTQNWNYPCALLPRVCEVLGR